MGLQYLYLFHLILNFNALLALFFKKKKETKPEHFDVSLFWSELNLLPFCICLTVICDWYIDLNDSALLDTIQTHKVPRSVLLDDAWRFIICGTSIIWIMSMFQCLMILCTWYWDFTPKQLAIIKHVCVNSTQISSTIQRRIATSHNSSDLGLSRQKTRVTISGAHSFSRHFLKRRSSFALYFLCVAEDTFMLTTKMKKRQFVAFLFNIGNYSWSETMNEDNFTVEALSCPQSNQWNYHTVGSVRSHGVTKME